MNESPAVLEVLSNRVDELEKRIHALEHPSAAAIAAVKPVIATVSANHTSEADSLQTANLFPLLGRAMLGIAGAYGLRAIAETGVMPKGLVATAAIAYALAWLMWAARAPRHPAIVPLVYAGTSVMILLPMLWEETLHFRLFAPIATAGILAAFLLVAAALEWRRDASSVLWISFSAAAAAGIAFSIATHAMLPFLGVLLLLLLLCEVARSLGRSRPMWPLAALAADATVWGMIFVYSGPTNVRAEYPELSASALLFPALLLFAISATSVAGRVGIQGFRITVAEIVQVTIAFGLAVSSVLYFAREAEIALGAACLILSAAIYGASFRYLRHSAEARNFGVFSMWGAALMIAGSLWSLPRSGAAIALAVAGTAGYFIADRMEMPILEFQGAVFFCASIVVSNMASYVFGALAGTQANRPVLWVWITGGSAAVAYFLGKDSSDTGYGRQLLRLVVAFVGVSACAALTVQGTLALARLAVVLDAHHVAFLRTFAISTVSLVLAFAGSRLGRVTMTRLAYVALAFVAAKLIFEDLRHGHMEFIAASIFLFAITLIAVPKLVRSGTTWRAALHHEMTASKS